MKLTPDQARAHADEVRRTSVTVLRGLIPVETIDQVFEHALEPAL